MTIRHVDAEITFSGLCLMQVNESRSWDRDRTLGPLYGRGIQVLLVNALAGCGWGADGKVESGTCRSAPAEDEEAPHPGSHPHYPRLNYYLEDHFDLRQGGDRWDGAVLPSPEGKEVVSIDLCDRKVEIIPPFDYRPKWSELRWCDRKPEGLPLATESEDTCLDWLVQGSQVKLDEPDPARAITEVTVPNGAWETHGTYRNREVASLDPIRWTFDQGAPRALARDIVLRLHNLRHGVTVRISERDGTKPRDIVLTPGLDDQLRFSISNLPLRLSESGDSHLAMFGWLAGGQTLADPVQQDDLVCVKRACAAMVKLKES